MTQRLTDIHASALAEFDKIQSAVYPERMLCLEDRRFYSIAGAQWEGQLGEQFSNKPKFEFNKVHLAVIRIINEYRNNRITVDFLPKAGFEDQKLADTCDDLFRADEQDSVAQEAYDNAFEEACAGGFGAFRLCSEYENPEDEEDERQRIRFEPIVDADSSVFFSLSSKRQDKRDAKRCYVIVSMSTQAYRDEYNDDPAAWPKEILQTQFDWYTPEVTYIAELYDVEKTKKKIQVWKGLDGEETQYTDEDFEADEGLENELKVTGSQLIKTKTIQTQRVRKYIMSGGKILEDCGYIAGKNIPIVPVYGKRWFVDNVERCMGHVRLAKDPQRLKNMQLSKLGEISALSSVQKPMMTPEQIAGHQQMWADDNIKNYPYLLINKTTTADGQSVIAPPVGYTQVPNVPPAMAALLQLTEQDMKEILGSQQAAEQIVSGVSGKAVEMIQTRLDMQTFIYMSNFAKAMKRAGEIWLSMAKELYVEEDRKMKTINQQGDAGTATLMKPMMDKESGAIKAENDMSNAELEVSVDVGPSSSSKRAATVRALTGMMQIANQDPETMNVLTSMAMMNMEGEGIGDVRDYFHAKLVNMGVVKPTPEEAQQLEAARANQKPDAQTNYLNAAAEEATAGAANKRADTVYKIAGAEERRASAVKQISSIPIAERNQTLQEIQAAGELQAQQSQQVVSEPANPEAAPVPTQPVP
jgi:hypothetical protein